MMTSHIYILTDGINTKIGITTDLVKRMATYKTHNATIQLVKKYPCSENEAKRVETAIKNIFKDQLTGKGKEWFSVASDVVVRYVSNLLEKPLTENILPSLHGAKLTDEAWELKDEISKHVVARGKTYYQLRQKFAELFAAKFSLGLPEHKLPEDIVLKQNLSVDTNHSLTRRKSNVVKEAVANNLIQMPFDDHVWRFFHLVPLASGHYVAICTAKVSMPYIERLKEEGATDKVVQFASDLGLYATFHHDWSWHSPDKTGLILYQPKTPIALTLKQWDKSFRKWVIERQEILKFEPFPDREVLEKTIEDVVRDNSFLLEFKTYPELCEKYFALFLGFGREGDEPHWQKEAHEYLIEKWKASVVQ